MASWEKRKRTWIRNFELETKNVFLFYLLFEGTFTSFFKDKKPKSSQNSQNQGFSYYFYLMIEG